MRYYILIGLLLAGLWGCDSGVEVERIAANQLISVSSFISPQDSIVRVYVFKGRDLGSSARADSSVLRDAQVTISDGNKSVVLPYNTSLRSYVVDNKTLKITASKQYQLRVKAGNIVCTASCKIPENPIAPIISQSRENDDFTGVLSWPATETARYFTLSYDLRDVIFRPQLGNTTGPYTGFLSSTLFDRQKQDSEEFEIRVFNAFKADKVSLRVVYQVIDEPTFNYLKTYRDFDNWRINSDGFIPNLREPQAVFSNIQGGVGIFGGYNQATLLFKIR